MAQRSALWIDHPVSPMQTAWICHSYNSLKLHQNVRAGRIPFTCQTSPRLFLRPVLSAKINAQQNSPLSQLEEKSGVVNEFPVTQYMFHADGGGQVRVSLEQKASTYAVKVEVATPNVEGPLQLHWGLFRSDSADWVLLEPESAPPQTTFLTGNDEAMRTPLQRVSSLQTLQFEISRDKTPFYISFVLHKPASENQEELWIRSSSGSNFSVPVGVRTGSPQPLGFTLLPDGSANFALFSTSATSVILCLYKPGDVEPAMEIDLDSSFHRTGDVWHVQLPSIGSFDRYGYRCKGEDSWENGSRFHKRRILLDPYAKFVAPPVPGQEELPSPATALGWLMRHAEEYDWGDDTSPCIPLERLVVYRLDVAGFTGSCSGLSEELRGTFMGVVEKIPHLKFLGVNAVVLQPIFSYDRRQGQYYPISFYSPMDLYGCGSPSSSLSASTSLKEMVKSLHQNGIEVILDVVYSHTAENGDDEPETVSFRGIDNKTYYVLDHRKRVLLSEAGKTNVFNCNHPAVHSMIVDSLRYWAEEFHVDGFSFVNAGGLLKGPHGEELSRPLLIEAISFDPILSKAKLVSDVWWPVTPVASPRVKFPHWKRWCELNKCFYDDVTGFFHGEQGKLSDFATRICGSADVFGNGRGPGFAFNFVSSPYGLTLEDLVTNSDTDQSSAGQPSRKLQDAGMIQDIRSRQIRNLFVSLFLSQGVPVLNMGDEYGLSSSTEAGKPRVFDWTKLDTESELYHLISSLSSLRARRKDLFQKRSYIEGKNISWHGPESLKEPLWKDSNSAFLAVTLKSSEDGAGDLFIVYNAQDEVVEVMLPELPKETCWRQIVDTGSPYPETVVKETTMRSDQASLEVQPCSVLVFEQLLAS